MVISPSEFRANLRKYFDLAHTERVIIRRSKGQSFALVPTHDANLRLASNWKRKSQKPKMISGWGKEPRAKRSKIRWNCLKVCKDVWGRL